MLLESDITRLGFKPDGHTKDSRDYASLTRANNGKMPKWKLRLQASEEEGRQLLWIRLYRRGRSGKWEYSPIFEGELNSPADLLRLFNWLNITIPSNFR